MPYITLYVTEKVLNTVTPNTDYQRQIAFRNADPALGLSQCTKNNQVNINLNCVFSLSVGDPGAIWMVHQSPGIQLQDFNDLYSLLARRAGTEVMFNW